MQFLAFMKQIDRIVNNRFMMLMINVTVEAND